MAVTDLSAEVLADRVEVTVDAFMAGLINYEVCRDAVREAWAQAAGVGLKVDVDGILQRRALDEMRRLMPLDDFATSA